MGGALLQQMNRDTQKFALKCSAAQIDGNWIDVYKDPVTDKGKRSKRGRMTLARHREYGTYETVPYTGEQVFLPNGYEEALHVVWENGELVRNQTFAEVRARASAERL